MQQPIYQHINDAFLNGLPYVLYKKPFEKFIQIQIQKNSNTFSAKNIDENGFVFAPFNSEKSSYYIPLSESTLYNISFDDNFFELSNKRIYNTDLEKLQHIYLVNQCVDFIKNGHAKKVVISRKQFIKKEEVGFEEQLNVFLKLIQLYQETMVYWWVHPATGIWMGATPERLLTLDKCNFQTMSLAGTQMFNDSITWQDKEKTEQKLVTNYIQEKLQEHVDELQIGAPYTKKAGHLAHICTDIKGTLKINKNLMELISVLHPTPAICGTPKENAFHYILKHEGYDRKFYTGYFGNIHLEEKSELFVNLRCMEWNNDGINLYIGGGITKDSIAENEWEETVNKSQIMAKVIL